MGKAWLPGAVLVLLLVDFWVPGEHKVLVGECDGWLLPGVLRDDDVLPDLLLPGVLRDDDDDDVLDDLRLLGVRDMLLLLMLLLRPVLAMTGVINICRSYCSAKLDATELWVGLNPCIRIWSVVSIMDIPGCEKAYERESSVSSEAICSKSYVPGDIGDSGSEHSGSLKSSSRCTLKGVRGRFSDMAGLFWSCELPPCTLLSKVLSNRKLVLSSSSRYFRRTAKPRIPMQKTVMPTKAAETAGFTPSEESIRA